jgi:tetratricopeptide (TPR) repeat protein
MNGFFAVRGRIATQHKWLNSALTAAKDTEDKQSEANVLKSLGDLELRSGNMDVALQHFNNKALALFKAERDVLGRANVLRSLGDLEFRLGNVRAARQHFENVLPLYQKVWAKTRMDENRI